jgi:hypothetical protein
MHENGSDDRQGDSTDAGPEPRRACTLSLLGRYNRLSCLPGRFNRGHHVVCSHSSGLCEPPSHRLLGHGLSSRHQAACGLAVERARAAARVCPCGVREGVVLPRRGWWPLAGGRQRKPAFGLEPKTSSLQSNRPREHPRQIPSVKHLPTPIRQASPETRPGLGSRPERATGRERALIGLVVWRGLSGRGNSAPVIVLAISTTSSCPRSLSAGPKSPVDKAVQVQDRQHLGTARGHLLSPNGYTLVSNHGRRSYVRRAAGIRRRRPRRRG